MTERKRKRARQITLNEQPVMRVSPALAAEIGLNESIMLLQLDFLISVGKHEHDGRRWTYQSVTALREMFPWWGRATILRIIRSLKARGLILTDNFNQHAYDKTTWFALNQDGIAQLKSVSLFQNGTTLFQSGISESQNGTSKSQNGTTIPETTPETTTESGVRQMVEPDESATATPKPEFKNRIQVPEEIRHQPKPQRNGRQPVESAEVLRLRLLPPNAAYFQTFRCWPTEANMRDLGDSITDMAAWGKVLKQFALEQRDKNRIDWLKERYQNAVAGVPVSGPAYRNGTNGKAHSPQPAGPVSPVAESIVPDGYRIARWEQLSDGSMKPVFEAKHG